MVVTHGAGSLDDEVADTAMGLLLVTVRELSAAERFLRAGRWPAGEYPLTPMTMSGRRLGAVQHLTRVWDSREGTDPRHP